MNFRMLWEKLVELSNSPRAIYVYLALVFGIVFIYRLKKHSKVKLMMSDERFRNAKLFASKISSPMAVSDDGYIGIVQGALTPPLVINIKEIAGFEVYFDGHSIANSGETEKSGLLFKSLAALIAQRMMEKTKKVNLVFFIEDKSIVNITLFSGGSRLISAIQEVTQKEIIQLLTTIENIESKLKQVSA